MKTIRRLGADAPQDTYRKTQRGALRHVDMTEGAFRTLEREHPDFVVFDGAAVLVAEPRSERIELHYAFPDQASFSKQFAPMFERLVQNLSLADTPFGVSMRLTDRAQRPYVEPALFAQAFEVTREWLRMELVELSADAFDALPSNFTLRPATPADVAEIVQLMYDSFDDPAVNPRAWAAAVADTDQLVRVLADKSSRIAGLLHLRPDDARTGYVSELAVHPDFQRRGLGEALMRWSLVWFRQQGFGRVALTTSPDNARAIALYHKLGFTVAEIGVDYRRSLDEDEVRQVLQRNSAAHITIRRAFP